MPTLSDLLQQVAIQQRLALLKSWQSETRNLARVYGNLWLDVQTEAELLAIKIEKGDYTAGTVEKSRDYQKLMALVIGAIAGFQALTLTSARDLQAGAIGQSYNDILRLVRMQAPTIGFYRPEQNALQVLTDYLKQGSPLWERINDYQSTAQTR